MNHTTNSSLVNEILRERDSEGKPLIDEHLEPRLNRRHARAHNAASKVVTRNEHVFGVANDADVVGLRRIRQVLPIKMRFDDAFALGRGLPMVGQL